MSNFMMNLISWILLLLVILTLYLIDKVNKLTSLQEEAMHPSPPAEPPPELEPPGDILFAGLEGKDLWDAMSGIPMAGYPPELVQKLRPHYEPVIRQHIEHVFMQGKQDGERHRHQGEAEAGDADRGIIGAPRAQPVDRGGERFLGARRVDAGARVNLTGRIADADDEFGAARFDQRDFTSARFDHTFRHFTASGVRSLK